MTARTLIIWGTHSGAGKSWLVTALCRWAARHGVNVAPFKAQNMSNNARVVPGLAMFGGAGDGGDGMGGGTGRGPTDGAGGFHGFGEIGSAQYFQALAARVLPSVDMNPVLLKPERDTASQVVVHGSVVPEWGSMPWRERSGHLAQAARQSLRRLRQAHELLVIEGAGSPAETNLAPHDFVNLDTARWAEARALLITDIDRGGAFAHLYGTWALLPSDLRSSLAGFVLNKFRGDTALLAPGPEQLRARTGVRTLAVLPMWREHGLPEEDGVFDHEFDARPSGRGPARLRVAVVAYPHLSNLDELQPLRQIDGLRLVWARDAAALETADWIVLPGSKQVSGDLAWLRAAGMDAVITRHAASGGAVLGICGGLQMLGASLADPLGHDGERGVNAAGLGLLPLATHFEPLKRVRLARLQFAPQGAPLAPGGPWAALCGIQAQGYEIRHGRSAALTGARAVLHDEAGEALGWQQGSVLGVCAHGLFESPAVLGALFGARVCTLDTVFDGLADHIDAAFAPGELHRLLLAPD